MKLASKSDFSVCSFDINMEELISPIYHLIVELFDTNDDKEHFYLWAKDLFDIEKITGSNTLADDVTHESFMIDVVSYLKKELYSNLEYFKERGVCFISIDNKIMIAHAQKKNDFNGYFSRWLQKFDPIKHLCDLINNGNIKKSQNIFSSLINIENYKKAVIVNDIQILETILLPECLVDKSKLSNTPIDNSSIWYDTAIENIVKKEVEEISISEIRNQEGVFLGFLLDNYYFPIKNVDNLIKDEKFLDYFWKMLDEVYIYKNNRKLNFKKETLAPFLNVCKEPDFCKMMSYIKYNLYIKKGDYNIPDRYLNLFEEVYNIDKPDDILSNYSFYTGIPKEIKGQTLLGVYEHKKKGTEYNLLNWINSNDDKHYNHTTIDGIETKKSIKVYALKPQYSYYYMSNYFEDSFSSILKEINCNYYTNLVLTKKGETRSFIEIDALVKCNDEKYMYFENKTTLNTYNIQETINKIVEFHQYMQDNYSLLKFEYVIIAPYCDKTLEDNYLYFINNGGIKQEKEGVGGNSYEFNIPIAKLGNVNLKCVVEPDYATMKDKVNKLVK